jgi:putative oxidoreductase
MTRAELETVWAPRLLGLLRIVAAILFMEHGAQKLLGFPPPQHGMPETLTLLWFAGVLELVGGFFLLIGLFTRPVAFLLSGQMAVAYWMAHAPQSPYPAINGGDAAILFCFLFLYFVASGPGSYSVDGAREGRAN